MTPKLWVVGGVMRIVWPLTKYSEDNLVKTPQGPRRLLSDEQLRLLGYNSDALDLKQKLTEDQRGQLIGNTFPVLVVARLLAGLCSI